MDKIQTPHFNDGPQIYGHVINAHSKFGAQQQQSNDCDDQCASSSNHVRSPSETSDNDPKNIKKEKKIKMQYPWSIGCILGNEFCERFSYYGMKTILPIFLTTFPLLLREDSATLVIHSFTVMCLVATFFGAILADNYIGRYWTIISLSIVYCLGNVVLTASAMIAAGVATHHAFATPALVAIIFALGIFLIACGTGGIRPCVASFGADQFAPEQRGQTEKFWSVFYFSVNAGSMLSSYLTPVASRHVGCFGMDTCYPLAFAIPAVLMMVAITIFVGGTGLYTKFSMKKPAGKHNMHLKVNPSGLNSPGKDNIIPSKLQQNALPLPSPPLRSANDAVLTESVVNTNNTIDIESDLDEEDTGIGDHDYGYKSGLDFYHDGAFAVPYFKSPAHHPVDTCHNGHLDEEASYGNSEEDLIQSEKQKIQNATLSHSEHVHQDSWSIKSECADPKGNYHVVTRFIKYTWLKILHRPSDEHEDFVSDCDRVYGIAKLLSPLLFFWALYDQQSSQWVYQAMMMDPVVRTPSGSALFKIFPEQMVILNSFLVLVLIPIFTYIVYPFCHIVTGFSMSVITKMRVGFFFILIAFVMTTTLQFVMARMGTFVPVPESGAMMCSAGCVSIVWQVPQFVCLTIAEIFVSISSLDAAYNMAPVRMRTVCQAVQSCYTAFGNVLVLIITLVQPARIFLSANAEQQVRMAWNFLIYVFIMIGACILFYKISSQHIRDHPNSLVNKTTKDRK